MSDFLKESEPNFDELQNTYGFHTKAKYIYSFKELEEFELPDSWDRKNISIFLDIMKKYGELGSFVLYNEQNRDSHFYHNGEEVVFGI